MKSETEYIRTISYWADQLSLVGDMLTTAATYSLRQDPKIVQARDLGRILIPDVTGRLAFDAEKLVAGIMAVTVVPDEADLVRFLYPHIRTSIAYGINLGPGIVSTTEFISSRETGGKVLANCCELLHLEPTRLNDVFTFLSQSKAGTLNKDGVWEILGYQIDEETAGALIEQAQKFQER